MNATTSTGILNLFERLSKPGAASAPAEALQEIARLFSASKLGFAGVKDQRDDLAYPEGAVTPLPWQKHPELLAKVQASWTACDYANADANWLLCHIAEPAGDGMIAWMQRPGKKGWSDADKVLWMLAAQGFIRWQRQAQSRTTSQERQLERAAVLTSRLTHEFGNYLTGIMGFTELSLSQAPLDSMLHRYLSEVLESAKQGAEWIRRLHVFCRREDGPAWPTQLASVLSHEHSRLRALGLLGTRWEVKLAPNLPLLAIDAEALQTAIAEVVANAREATRDRGVISFTAQLRDLNADDCRSLLGSASPGPHIELAISDDGPGITPENYTRILNEIFFSTKTRHRGLGFLVIYGILRRCHGGLAIDPGSANNGICVRLYVPSANLAGPPLLAGAEPHVLIVHADSLLTTSMREMLEARGCKVSIAGNTPTALAICRAKGADVNLVVTDLMLPHLGGLDLARRILDHNDQTGFVFLLAQASFHGLRDEELLKRFDLLRWPSEPAAFLNTIQTALARSSG